MTIDRRSLLLGAGASLTLAGCGREAGQEAATQPPPAPGKAGRLIAAARRQIGVTTSWNGTYAELAFPGGDVPRSTGSCTEVIIRAYRDALAEDLQALVNADMRRAFAAYPRTWGLSRPDPNIDHRRVPNLRTWFTRHGASLPVPRDASCWQPGDIFTSLVENRSTHIGLVSDRRGRNGWLIIHNIGLGAREEDALRDWPVTGRYRWGLA
ncbi:MAG TPA: DUF1287 domain-containing protein [Allosphingosinicella sp.]|nr:DUF1287 domain-containing protein [Allosphingosinicella sp.]